MGLFRFSCTSLDELNGKGLSLAFSVLLGISLETLMYWRMRELGVMVGPTGVGCLGGQAGRWSLSPGFLCALAAVGVVASLGIGGCGTTAPGEVGNVVCLACHDGFGAPDPGIADASVHVAIGCERCHGPGYLHVRNGGRGGLFIERLGAVPFDESHLLCAECHEGTAEAYLQSAHWLNEGASCADCHNVHAANGARDDHRDNTMCLKCHEGMGFGDASAIGAHTYHSVDPAGTGASRCTTCHMPPLQRADQQDGPHGHNLFPLQPISSNEAAEAGVDPVPPNSCSGITGCHDGTVETAPQFDVDNPKHNALLQLIYEARYGT